MSVTDDVRQLVDYLELERLGVLDWCLLRQTYFCPSGDTRVDRISDRRGMVGSGGLPVLSLVAQTNTGWPSPGHV